VHNMSITATNKSICTIKSATPEGGIQKAVIITPSKLQLINVDITDDFVDLLIHEKIKDLIFEDCSMPEEVGQLFVTSKESVLFKNCILTDPENGDEIIGNLGFRKTEDGVYAYDPQVTEIGQKFSKLPPETLETLKAPLELESLTEDATIDNEILAAIADATKFVTTLHETLENLAKVIAFHTELHNTEALEIPNKLKERIVTAQLQISKAIDRHNQSTDCPQVIFTAIKDAIKNADLVLDEFFIYMQSDA
jgi:hypothetical protein